MNMQLKTETEKKLNVFHLFSFTMENSVYFNSISMALQLTNPIENLVNLLGKMEICVFFAWHLFHLILYRIFL